ncbi:MAG: hypothetical protein AAGB51_08795 [Planctomycetota bacterium]
MSEHNTDAGLTDRLEKAARRSGASGSIGPMPTDVRRELAHRRVSVAAKRAGLTLALGLFISAAIWFGAESVSPGPDDTGEHPVVAINDPHLISTPRRIDLLDEILADPGAWRLAGRVPEARSMPSGSATIRVGGRTDLEEMLRGLGGAR